MNKQTVHSTDSAVNLLEAGAVTKSHLSSSSVPRKYKVLIVVVGILATVAICAAIAVAVGTSLKLHTLQPSESSMEQHGSPLDTDMETSEQMFIEDADFKTVAKRQANKQTRSTDNQVKACYSEKTNETYPAARIAGRGFKWTTMEPGNKNSPQVSGYQSSWVCANKSGAFVDGGMYFNHGEKKLHVPICGYYSISSHVYFQSDNTASTRGTKYVRHEVIIEKNCNYSQESDTVILRSYSSLVASPTSYGRTSTHIGDVVKMCEKGSIQVIIPDDYSNGCCPYGRSQSTYLSAYMVSKTSCDRSIPQDHPFN